MPMTAQHNHQHNHQLLQLENVAATPVAATFVATFVATNVATFLAIKVGGYIALVNQHNHNSIRFPFIELKDKTPRTISAFPHPLP